MAGVALAGMLCIVLLLLLLPAGRVKRQPHIVFIMADDLGWDDVSFHGSSQIPTPNLDALAADGIILNSFYAQPSCTPSRSALLTGLYAIRTGLQAFTLDVADPWGLPLNVRLLPEYLREIGYETHLVGKWGIGYYKTSLTPTCRGFDSFYGYHSSEEDYYTHSVTYENHTGVDFWLNMEPLFSESGSYSTTLFTERAQYLIRNRNRSKEQQEHTLAVGDRHHSGSELNHSHFEGSGHSQKWLVCELDFGDENHR
ncbi:arylsulfatase B-like [Dermacentor andersoni]|uniref:arylsulfatase B-like n=1 Tax=Dermacentor andersoni TaxID=34620 RepID=UPI003B3B2DB3